MCKVLAPLTACCFAFAHAGCGGAVASWREAPVHTGSGRVIALWRQSKGGESPVVAKKDYAMVIVGRGPQSAYYLLDNRKKRYMVTYDFQRFLEEVSKLPFGAGFELVDKCHIGLSYGTPEANAARLLEVVRAGGHANAEGFVDCNIACTCGVGCTGVRPLGAHPAGPTGAPVDDEGDEDGSE